MKRKIKDEAEAYENEAETRPVKRSRGRHGSSPWTEDQDETLASLYREHKVKGTKGMWNVIYDTFVEKYPDANKTKKAMQRRVEEVLRNGTVELEDEEMNAFEKAVNDIDNHRVRYEAIAWRFGQISKSSKTMSKTAVGKLLKKLKSRQSKASKVADDNNGGGLLEEPEQGVKNIKLEKSYDEDGEGSNESRY